jgi:hypothetical protein
MTTQSTIASVEASGARDAHGLSHVLAVAIDAGVIVALVAPVRLLLDELSIRTLSHWSQLVFAYIAVGFVLALPASMLALVRGPLSVASRLAMGINGAVAWAVLLVHDPGHYTRPTSIAVTMVAPVLVRLSLMQTAHRAGLGRLGLLAFSLVVAILSLGGRQVLRASMFAHDRALSAVASLRSVSVVQRALSPPRVVVVDTGEEPINRRTVEQELPLALLIRVAQMRHDTPFDRRFAGFVTIARNSARFVDVRANAVSLGAHSTFQRPPPFDITTCASAVPSQVALCARERLSRAGPTVHLRLELVFLGRERMTHQTQYERFVAEVDRAVGAVLVTANARTPLRNALVVLEGMEGFAPSEPATSPRQRAFVDDDGQRAALLISAPGVRPAFVRGAFTIGEADDAILRWGGQTPPTTSSVALAAAESAPRDTQRLLLSQSRMHRWAVTVTDGRYVLGIDRRIPTYSLIDLSLDPQGLVNRADILPAVVHAMRDSAALALGANE